MTHTPDTYHEKSKDLVAQMSLKEKVGLMSGRRLNMLKVPIHALVFKHYNRTPYENKGVERLGVPTIKFCDGPRGVVSQNSTCFPVAMARGATFDQELEEAVGVAMAREIRAAGGNYFGGVCINLLRHPAWGRAQETYGEDPCLLGKMGVSVTRGVQSQGVMACLKHFAMNSMENARFKIDVTCSQRTLREVYLPHFKDCIDAGAASVMTAYNKVRGQYCGENEELLRTILKGEWEFDGFVISDFVWGVHSTRDAVRNGMDIEMPWPNHFANKLVKAVNSGSFDIEHIDDAAVRIVQTVLKFDDILQQSTVSPDVVVCEEHKALARTVAEKSMTLLKNQSATLPFSASNITRLAVLGELADVENIGDHGSSKVVPPYVVTVLEGLKNYLGESVQVDHCAGSDAAAITEAIAAADAVVVVVGNRHDDEGEFIMNSKNSPGGDRDHLSLRPDEVAMIRAAARENSNLVVVLIGGSAITLSEWEQEVPGILLAYYPGMEGGNAVARTLFGEVNPGGKLPFSIPLDSSQLPFFDKNAETIEYGYYHGYTLLQKEGQEPAYAFGFGESYTRFELTGAVFERRGDSFWAEITIQNAGECAGDEVLQLYMGCSQSEVDRPLRILRDFKRVSLEPGESMQVCLSAPLDTLSWYDETEKVWVQEDAAHEMYIGTSSRPEDLVSGLVTIA